MTASNLILDQRYEVVPIDCLEPHPENPNSGDLAAIGESISANRFYGATLVRELAPGRYQILAGEHRWRELREKGSDVIPVIIASTDDEVHAIRILLADNETAKRSTYRPDVLTRVLQQLPSLEGTGFYQEDLEDLARLEDERVEPDPGPDEGKDFTREYGIVVTFDDEESQAGFYEWLLENGGLEPHQIRIASI